MKQQHININRTSYTEYSGDQEVYALHLTVGSVDKKVIDNIHLRLVEMLTPLLAVTENPNLMKKGE